MILQVSTTKLGKSVARK